jgi:PBSX family phage terminase large subunit
VGTINVKTPISPRTGEKPFLQLYHLPVDTNLVILIGGRGGMKTYEASKFVAMAACIKEKRCVILRDEKSLIRESILNEVLMRFDTANSNGALEKQFERLDTGLKNRVTNEMQVFTKGFRASAKEKKANLKSISNIDIAVIEEFEDIRDEEQFFTFSDSIRKEGALVILILNTPDINHFIIKRYFNLELVEDGFFKITPKVLPGFVCIQTGYLDNPHLPKNVIDRYTSYGDSDSNLYNRYYYMTAIQGFASTGRRGQILTKVKPIKLEEYLKLPFTEIYGQDFGTASPAGFVGVKFDKNNCYMREISYVGMNLLDLAKMYCQMGFTQREVIICDSAEPLTIGKLRAGWRRDEISETDAQLYPQLLKGFNVYGVVKAPGSIKAGLDTMDGINLFCVEESKNAWNEIYNYIYAQDMSGQYTGEPIDDFNHLIDPWRYVVQSKGRYF